MVNLEDVYTVIISYSYLCQRKVGRSIHKTPPFSTINFKNGGVIL